MIPEQRQAIHGRTWDRMWQPEAVEHHRRRSRCSQWLRDIAAALVLGVLLALSLWFALAGG